MKGKKVDAGDQVGLSRRVLVPRFWFSTLKGSFIFPPILRPVAPYPGLLPGLVEPALQAGYPSVPGCPTHRP